MDAIKLNFEKNLSRVKIGKLDSQVGYQHLEPFRLVNFNTKIMNK